MPEPSPSTNDSSGVTRTPTGEIQSPPNTSTQPSTPQDQVVRPPPSPSTTQETKPKQETKTDGKASDKSLVNEKAEEPKGAPEKYEDFKVPEGYTLDSEVAKDASALFKRLDLNQSGAQELVDFYVAKTKEAFEAPFNAYMDKRQEWRDQVNALPEIGGSKLKSSQSSIAKLIDSIGDSKVSDAFREAMDLTGAGDHPAVVQALVAWAKRLTEGGAVKGNGPVTEGQRDPNRPAPSAAQAIYPNLPSSRS